MNDTVFYTHSSNFPSNLLYEQTSTVFTSAVIGHSTQWRTIYEQKVTTFWKSSVQLRLWPFMCRLLYISIFYFYISFVFHAKGFILSWFWGFNCRTYLKLSTYISSVRYWSLFISRQFCYLFLQFKSNFFRISVRCPYIHIIL